MVLHRPVGTALAVIGLAGGLLAACSSGGSDPAGSAAGPGGGSAATAGISRIDETVTTPDGRTRTYRVVVPGSVRPDEPVPLLLALHGGVGSGAQFERTSGFDDLAATHRFIVVYPDGIEIGGASVLATGHVWNGGKCCGRAARVRVDDVGFIAAVIDRVSEDHRVDPDRVFAAGHSNGAIMSYRLACELSDRIAAIGVQAGTIEVDGCTPTRPVSVLAIHGTADTNIPIEGGKGRGISGATFSSPVAAVETFARLDGCSPSSTRTAPDNPDVTIETWPGGRAGTEVRFARVTGATHAWMGHPSPRASTGLTGEPYQRFDSSAAIWDFLSAHPRRD